jgi:hypothetical protein
MRIYFFLFSGIFVTLNKSQHEQRAVGFRETPGRVAGSVDES